MLSRKAATIIAGLAVIAAVSAVGLFLNRTSGVDAPPHEKAADAGHEPESSLAAAAGRATEVSAGTIETYVKAPGLVDFHPKHALRIHPAYSGVVLRVSKKLGDAVSAGEVLATIESNMGIQVYSVTSPIKGTILERRVGEGQSVSPEDELFSVGDASVLQARLSVAARDVRGIKAGMDVLLVSENDRPIRAKTTFMTPILSEETRTATVLVDFASPDALPGMFVTGAIVMSARPIKMALPASFCAGAISRKRLIVLDATERTQREVVFGARDYDTCEVLGGLEAGAKVLMPTNVAMEATPEHKDHNDE